MISRRSIRTKSFQVIYSQQFEDTGRNGQEALDFFAKGIEKVYSTYFFNVALVIKGLHKVREKGKLADGELPELADFKKLLAKAAPMPNANGIITEALKSYSAKFVEQEKVIDEFYEGMQTRLNEQSFDNPVAFYKWLQADADYNELFAEQLINGAGSDDYSIVTGTMRKTVKGFPAFTEVDSVITSDDDATINFGDVLIKNYFDEDAYYNSLLESHSRNWEIDRVAMIDKILIKMAIAEMVSFPSIPVNVSINEYIEISKVFSLDKSKEYINGILDKVAKKLQAEGRIVKDGGPEAPSA